jgi:outer membrane protein assembly factor BamB
MKALTWRAVVGCVLLVSLGSAVKAEDWPTWRHGVNRAAATAEALPTDLGLQWVREFGPPQAAWPRERRLRYDWVHEPIVVGKRVFVALSNTDKVVALDSETGRELWTFYTGGPVRFAPAAWRDRLFVGSDDGYLYCLDAARGTLIWKFRGGPSQRAVLGNGRLISTWCVRGGPVVAGGTVYFTAGIWPFMGVFVHALDAQTGKVVWTNENLGHVYTYQKNFVGLAPQGYLVALGDQLVIPCGRSVPARLDLKTGRLIYLANRWDHSRSGNCQVSGVGDFMFTGAYIWDLVKGGRAHAYRFIDTKGRDTVYRGYAHEPVGIYRHPRVLTPEAAYTANKDYFANTPDDWGKLTKGKLKLVKLVGEATEIWIKAGPSLYGSAEGKAMALDPSNGRVSWRADVPGTIGGMVAADGKLFVTTREGAVYCFGQTATGKTWKLKEPAAPTEDAWAQKADAILKETGVKEGYCLVMGLESGLLVEALAQRSALTVIGIDRDEVVVAAARARLDEQGLYGTRAAVLLGDPLQFPFPPYLASLVVSEDPARIGWDGPDAPGRMFRLLRPYGGLAYVKAPAGYGTAFAGSAGAERTAAGEFTKLVRAGAPVGSADVTHEGVDAANSFCSKDDLVRLPLGLLWYGGEADADLFLPKTNSSRPQVAGGRMFVEGLKGISAIDVYSGRVLWTAKMARGYKPYFVTESRTGKAPPSPSFRMAGVHGVRMVSMPDGVYAAQGTTCVRIDPATGEKMPGFSPPEGNVWGSLAVSGDVLLATANPVSVAKGDNEARYGLWRYGVSATLMAMDRHTGKALWVKRAALGFRHASIAADRRKVFCIDRLPDPLRPKTSVDEKPGAVESRMLALDLRNGAELWSTTEDVKGTWLAYSEKNDILLEGPAWGEPRVRARSGKDGSILWRKDIGAYTPMAFLHHERVLIHRSIYDLRTGTRILDFDRGYGCGMPAMSENLLILRSNGAAFYDLKNYGGMGNIVGVRSACSNNMVAAGGVLSMPNVSSGCVCDYPIQTSMALVHDPGVEYWTWGGRARRPGRLAVNLGAPGDRTAPDGTIWRDFPSGGGNVRDLRGAPDVPVKTEPRTPEWFRYRPARVKGDGPAWVAASGGIGIRSVTVQAKDGEYGLATVRLLFAEPKEIAVGERVFDVSLQGLSVLKGLDVAKEAGGPYRCLVKEFKDVKIETELKIELAPTVGEPILCGIQIIGANARP